MIATALPDPYDQPDFYSGVTAKRLLAWIVDTVFIALLTALFATLPLFVGWFFLPLVYMSVSFLYRWISLTNSSATPGMRMFNVQFRNRDGALMNNGEALIHTLAYMVATALFIPQVISVILILMSERGQALHDLLCGTALINRPSRY